MVDILANLGTDQQAGLLLTVPMLLAIAFCVGWIFWSNRED